MRNVGFATTEPQLVMTDKSMPVPAPMSQNRDMGHPTPSTLEAVFADCGVEQGESYEGFAVVDFVGADEGHGL